MQNVSKLETLMQIEFTINPPGSATEVTGGKKGKSQENLNGDPGTMSMHLHIHH